MNYFIEDSDVVAVVPDEEPLDELELEEIIRDYESE